MTALLSKTVQMPVAGFRLSCAARSAVEAEHKVLGSVHGTLFPLEKLWPVEL
jgi:hypothetical protein